MAQACWEAVDDAIPGGEPAVLVGCSVGSTLAPQMYHMRPKQTAALVLAGTGYRAPGTSDVGPRRIKDYSQNGIEFRWDHTFVDFSPAFRATPMAHFFAGLFTERNDFGDVQSIIYQFAAPEHSDDSFYTGIRCPTIILTGSEDNAHTRSFALKEKIPGCELKVLPGAGHACQIEQPWLFDRFMLEFLDRHGLFSGKPRPRVARVV
jgi:pimeloyl-ACP methyl ester carboxylesterase